ncbi:hypothetical protein GGI25_002347 [Coemansia spiralis]|uniref:F-box domain-containing protein n=2 Tax=Coemansia TaxID=4863 RepID=A0A9W8GA66_9FUNG|nr:hypothetical protein EDC05_004310 [Coemansia umbellata]KAJ2622151.1 hypothetical protein GGI26_003446 [Coemansia sp. RSA 1358]KAJ2678362.1 hypothetical protein GGI25_002347 [Coemansia spiralis]
MWKLSWMKGGGAHSPRTLDSEDRPDSDSGPMASSHQKNKDDDIDDSGSNNSNASDIRNVSIGTNPVSICIQARTWNSSGSGASAYTPTSPLSSSQTSLRPFMKATPASFGNASSNPSSTSLLLQPYAFPHPPNVLAGKGSGGGSMKRKDSFVSNTLGRAAEGMVAGTSSTNTSVASADGKIDFLSCLPYEIAMVIVIHADFPTILTIAQVSRSWRRFACDNAVWRRLFLQQSEWRTPRALAAAGYHRRNNHKCGQQSSYGSLAGLKRLHSGNFGGSNSNVFAMEGSNSGMVSPSACSTNGMNTPRIGDDISFSASSTSPMPPPTHPLLSAYAGSSLRPALALQHMAAPSPTPSMVNGFSGRLKGADWRYLFQQRLELDRHWDQGIADMQTITGHADSVYCVQCDHDKIVTGSRDRTVKVWDSQTLECLRTFTGHDASVLCLKYDETTIVTGSSDATVIVWDWETGGPKMRLISHSAGVLDVAFNADYIVSCSKDCTIKVWQRSTGKLIRTMSGHRGPVNAVQLRGDKIVSASGDSLIKMWDVKTGELIRTFAGHTRGLACVQFDGKTIVSGSSDQLIKVWEADTGQCVQTLRGHKDLVRTLHFSGGRRAVSGSYDQTIKVWDIVSGKCTLDLKDVHTSWVFDVQFSASRIVSTSQDQKIIIWDFSKGLDVSEID